MEIFKENILEWLFVLAFLGVLAYTAIIIRKEKSNFIEDSIPKSIRHFTFFVPKWWTQTGGEENSSLIFQRTDTRYDWKSTFVWTSFEEVGKGHTDIRKTLVEIIEQKEIVFDPDSSVIHNPEDFYSREEVQSGDIEILRIEGTATEKQIERLYFDAFLIKDHKKEGFIFAESRSSVLNGLVEGPYFEEVLLSFERSEN